MSPRSQTLLILLGIALEVAALDVWLLLTGRPTFSAALLDTARAHPVWSFLMGVVVGALAAHLFWFQVRPLVVGSGQ